MLFLLGINKFHPIVRILIGAALVAVGLGLGVRLLAIPGVFLMAWGACNWYTRSRTNARREEARLHKEGAAR